MTSNYRIAIGVSIDSSAAKTGGSEAKAVVASIGAEAEKTATKITAANDAIGKLDAAGKGKARQQIADIGAAADQTRSKIQGVVNAWAGFNEINSNTDTRARDIAAYGAELDRLQAKFDPLFAIQSRYKEKIDEIAYAERTGAISATTAIDARLRETSAMQSQISALSSLASARKQEAEAFVLGKSIMPDRGSDIAAYGKELDQLRARFNPVFSVLTQYKATIAEIREANRVGAISHDEMAAAISRERQATLASIDAIKGRNSIRGQSAGMQNFAATSTMFQLQDIGMTAAMGMNPGMIGLQQGTQLAGGFAGMSLKEAATTTASAFTGLLSPVSLLAVGLTTATAAGIQYAMSTSGEVKKLDDVLENHRKTIDRLEKAYGDVITRARDYGRESPRVLSAVGRDNLAALQTISKQENSDLSELFGVQQARTGGARDVETRFIPFAGAIQKLRSEMKAGKPDFDAFWTSVDNIAAESGDKKIRKIGDELILASQDAATAAEKFQEAERAAKALFDTVGPGGRLLSQGALSRQDNGDFALFQSRETVDARRRREAYEASIDELNARSPAQIAAAARRSAAAVDSDESAPARRDRIDAAGKLALARAEKQLADARRDRMSSLDQSLEGQRLELSVIGKTIAEQERLRMEHQLIGELKREAERNGIAVDQDEIARIREKAAAYGQLAEQISATNVIRGQRDELARLDLEKSLLGASAQERSRAIAMLEAEQLIRERGYNTLSQESDLIRANAKAIAEKNLELERAADAWGKVGNTIDGAIDTLFDKLKKGDWEGALKEIGDDFGDTLIDLAAKNPVKNALNPNSNAGTLDDVGGIAGIFNRLFGGGSDQSSPLGQSVASMQVQAANVMINGGVAGFNGLPSASNDNDPFRALLGGNPSANSAAAALKSAGVTRGGIPLSEIATSNGLTAKVATEYAPRFQKLFEWLDGKGYKINSLGEGGYSYRNVAGTNNLSNHSFGEAIDINPRDNPWSYSGRTNLPAGTSEYARSIGLKWGGDWRKPDTMHFQVDKNADVTALALQKVGTASNAAMTGLQNVGTGFTGFSQQLMNAANSGGGGGGGILGMFGKLIGGISPTSSLWSANTTLGSFLTNGFDNGGWTGNMGRGDIAGFVHGQEFVVKAGVVAKPGVRSFLHALNDNRLPGYERGGFVAPNVVYPEWTSRSQAGGRSADSGPVAFTIENHSSTPLKGEMREERDSSGRRRMRAVLDEQTASTISEPGSASNRTLQSMGVPPFMLRR